MTQLKFNIIYRRLRICESTAYFTLVFFSTNKKVYNNNKTWAPFIQTVIFSFDLACKIFGRIDVDEDEGDAADDADDEQDELDDELLAEYFLLDRSPKWPTDLVVPVAFDDDDLYDCSCSLL